MFHVWGIRSNPGFGQRFDGQNELGLSRKRPAFGGPRREAASGPGDAAEDVAGIQAEVAAEAEKAVLG
jgi:hypothetical protein